MTVITPLSPTYRLSPIAKIKSTSVEDLVESLRYLRLLYNPEVRGTRRLGQRTIVFGSKNSAAKDAAEQRPRTDKLSDNDDSMRHSLDAIRPDRFERSYAVRWMTFLISQADRFSEDHTDIEAGQSNESHQEFCIRWENLIQDAAALLAICAGTASAGMVSRAFVFHRDPEPDITVQVTDAPLENQDYSSVGAQTWGSAFLLAEMIVDSPLDFGLTLRVGSPLRVLELGAGTGLVSLVIAKLLQSLEAKVVATDFHTSVLKNLRHNIEVNGTLHSLSQIEAHFLDWSHFPSSTPSPPLDEPFDLIFGADIIYEPQHATWIKSCLEILLRKPGYDTLDRPDARFHLMIPLRPTHIKESSSVEGTFPFADAYPRTTQTPHLANYALVIASKEILTCEADGSVRPACANVVEYAHYTIAWMPQSPRESSV